MKKKENIFASDDNPIEKPLVRELERLCSGLSYMSETDAPIEVFIGEKAERVSRENVLDQTRHTEAAIEEISAELFFKKLTTVREWYNEEQTANACRFDDLQKHLKDSLTDLRVFRIGTIRIDIYVIGLDADGRIVGIKTKAVET